MDNRPIGMFDSGVGGLTVYKEIKKVLPSQQIIYIGDTKRFPYGSKTKESIIDASIKCIDFLISNGVKEIIIACGTATSRALDTLKTIYNVPITGIIEPTVQYIIEKDYKTVGVIATRGTIESNSWEKSLHNHKSEIQVYNQECPLLAPMAEEGWTNNEIAKLTIKEYLRKFKDVNINALILGCTHFPLFEDAIKKCMPGAEIINTGKVIAEKLLKSNNKEERKDTRDITNDDKIFITDTQCNFEIVAKKILEKDIAIKGIDL